MWSVDGRESSGDRNLWLESDTASRRAAFSGMLPVSGRVAVVPLPLMTSMRSASGHHLLGDGLGLGQRLLWGPCASLYAENCQWKS